MSGIVITAAIAWGGLGIATSFEWVRIDPGVFARVAIFAVPLALALLLHIVLTRSSHGEARRFRILAGGLRHESIMLDRSMTRMAEMIVRQNRLLADQAGQLTALGDETADRLRAIEQAFARDTANIADHGERIARTAAAARTDMGVLLVDLPRVDAQIRSLSEQLRDAGIGAHERVGALETQLIALTAHSREVDEQAGGAAQRLAAHLARVESASEIATRQLDQAGKHMTDLADAALARAAQVLGDLRAALATEQDTLTTLVSRAGALIGDAGVGAVAALGQHIDTIEARLTVFSAQVAREGGAVRTLSAAVDDDLARSQDRFAALAVAGGDHVAGLIDALTAMRAAAAAASTILEEGDGHADRLLDHADHLTRTIDTIGTALQGADLASARIAARVEQSGPAVDGFARDARAAATAIDTVDDRLSDQSEAVANIRAGIAAADGEVRALIDQTSPAALAAIERVRAAGDDAAQATRDAFATIAPDAADRLAAAGHAVLERALPAEIDRQLRALGRIADHAAEVATVASERLARQMAAIAETTAAVEQRIEAVRGAAERTESESLSRRVALLIEALNSTAIDVAKILSNDVTDSAWAAYLRGDRGVFTRRAVRLLDHGEARAVAAKYGDDAEFREQVNRYVHDFEAMLRRILASRDGTLLSVTLLSSDMGKLYVALAQAIERLR